MAQESGKPNRRVEMTKTIIKDGMLSLLTRMPFRSVSVSALCKEAGVGRATFYTHYTGLMDVIDELADEAIQAAGLSTDSSVAGVEFLNRKIPEMASSSELEQYMHFLPLCQRVAHSPRYNVMFRDDELSEYIILRIYRIERKRTIPVMVEKMGLTQEQADRIFLFGVMGAFAVNRAMGWKKDEEWYDIQLLLLTYANGGYEAIKKRIKKLE